MLPSGYEIKSGSPGDQALLVKFMYLTYKEMFPTQDNFSHLAETVNQYLGKQTPLWWVIPSKSSRQQEAVGCIWLGKAIDQVTGLRTTHIFLLYVLPQYRRQGIATALMKQAQSWAIEQGDRQISLMVYSSNQQALKLYQSLGYQQQSMLMFKELDLQNSK